MVQKVCQNRIRDNKLRYSVLVEQKFIKQNLKLRDEKGCNHGQRLLTLPSLLLLLLLHDLGLLGEHHLDKLLVVDVPLRVLLAMYQLLNLLLGHFLPEASQQVAQFNGRDSSVSFLVKMAQPFNKVVNRVCDLSGHRLEEREEGFECDASIRASLAVRGLHQLLHVPPWGSAPTRGALPPLGSP